MIKLIGTDSTYSSVRTGHSASFERNINLHMVKQNSKFLIVWIDLVNTCRIKLIKIL